MFSKEITNSSEFLMMSQSAQNLYFHFGMNADDDGFCEVFTIMRMTDSKPDDLRALHEKGFVYVVDNKVCIIKDWHENNQLRLDRYKSSKYLDDPKYLDIYKIIMEEKIKEISIYSKLLSDGKPNGNQMVPQERIGKVRLGKERVEKPEQSLSFLKEITDETINELVMKFKCDNSQVKTKANALYDYCEAKGKKYKNYKSFLSNALRKDFGERPQPTKKQEVEFYLDEKGQRRARYV